MNNNLTGYPSIDKPQNNNYPFFSKHPLIPNMSVYNTIKLLNSFCKDKTAIDCLDITASYKQLIDDAVTISRALKELSVKKGQIVAISMDNFYQAVASFMACNRIGAVTTFLNGGAAPEETEEYLNLFESPVFINFDKTKEENLRFKKNTDVKHIITLNKKNINNLSLEGDYHVTSSDDLIDFNSLGSIANFQKKGISSNNGNDDSLILFTSGSTGKPKAVVLSNKNVLASGIYMKNTSNVTALSGDRTLVCVPFMYPYGFATSTLLTLMSNKTAILAPNMSKETISKYLKKNPNIVFGSPALLDLIMKNVPENQDLSSISQFVSGGDFLTPSHSKTGVDFFEQHGAKNVEMGNGSGNAETVSCGTDSTGIVIRPETVGRILVGTDAMVVDEDTMEEKKYNEEGLLCVSGHHVFKGYFKDSEATEQAKFTRDGKTYFKTGTMGFIDKDGYFTLTGRQSRFYIISTLNKVYCDHVQLMISNLDAIKECAIVKVPDNDMLYKNKAYIVLNDGIIPNEETKEELFNAFNTSIKSSTGEVEQLKWYEVPSDIEFVDNLPRRQGTEKIDYPFLEKDAENKQILSNEKIKKIIKK
ncbi:MAG: class I adenylate-forming enzyme family protein [Bacilli bacterium]